MYNAYLPIIKRGFPFLFGCACDASFLRNQAEADWFNSIYPGRVAESAGNFGRWWAERDAFDMDDLQTIYAAKQALGRYHVHVWPDAARYNLIPDWFYSEQDKTAVYRSMLTMTRDAFPNMNTWVVGNELYNVDGSLRPSVWDTMPGYPTQIFMDARRNLPTWAQIEYNSDIWWLKDTGALERIRALAGDGLIDRLGLQCHDKVADTAKDDASWVEYCRDQIVFIADEMARYGVKVGLTEIDVRMRVQPDKRTPVDPADLDKQANHYAMFGRVARQHKNIDQLFVWGRHDGASWIPAVHPGWGAPLLFTADKVAKPAWWALRDG